MHAIDALVTRLREETGLGGFPGLEGTRQLAGHLGERVRVREDPKASFGYCHHRKDRSTSVWTPPGAADILSHELGHHFDAARLAGCFHFLRGGLGLPGESPSEGFANRFARAWLLPVDLLRGGPWGIARLSGCSLAVVFRRMV